MAQDAHSVEFRQVQIQDDDLMLQLRGRGSSLFTIWQNIHRVGFAVETRTKKSRQGFIIFCNKNSPKVNLPLIQPPGRVRNRLVVGKAKPTLRSVCAGVAHDFKPEESS
jgi:hypothetical protein